MDNSKEDECISQQELSKEVKLSLDCSLLSPILFWGLLVAVFVVYFCSVLNSHFGSIFSGFDHQGFPDHGCTLA